MAKKAEPYKPPAYFDLGKPVSSNLCNEPKGWQYGMVFIADTASSDGRRGSVWMSHIGALFIRENRGGTIRWTIVETADEPRDRVNRLEQANSFGLVSVKQWLSDNPLGEEAPPPKKPGKPWREWWDEIQAERGNKKGKKVEVVDPFAEFLG